MKLILLPILLIFNNVIKAETINVPDSYSTIQAAINASSDFDTVLVSAGFYQENIDFATFYKALVDLGTRLGPVVTLFGQSNWQVHRLETSHTIRESHYSGNGIEIRFVSRPVTLCGSHTTYFTKTRSAQTPRNKKPGNQKPSNLKNPANSKTPRTDSLRSSSRGFWRSSGRSLWPASPARLQALRLATPVYCPSADSCNPFQPTRIEEPRKCRNPLNSETQRSETLEPQKPRELKNPANWISSRGYLVRGVSEIRSWSTPTRRPPICTATC